MFTTFQSAHVAQQLYSELEAQNYRIISETSELSRPSKQYNRAIQQRHAGLAQQWKKLCKRPRGWKHAIGPEELPRALSGSRATLGAQHMLSAALQARSTPRLSLPRTPDMLPTIGMLHHFLKLASVSCCCSNSRRSLVAFCVPSVSQI